MRKAIFARGSFCIQIIILDYSEFRWNFNIFSLACARTILTRNVTFLISIYQIEVEKASYNKQTWETVQLAPSINSNDILVLSNGVIMLSMEAVEILSLCCWGGVATRACSLVVIVCDVIVVVTCCCCLDIVGTMKATSVLASAWYSKYSSPFRIPKPSLPRSTSSKNIMQTLNAG